jgi:hypothetical protein
MTRIFGAKRNKDKDKEESDGQVSSGPSTGEPVPCGWSFWTPDPKPGMTIQSRSSASYGRRLPTSDFGIVAAHTSSCNVSRRSRARNGSNTAASQAPTPALAPDWRAQQPKQFPAGLPCGSLAGILLLQISCFHSETSLRKNR